MNPIIAEINGKKTYVTGTASAALRYAPNVVTLDRLSSTIGKHVAQGDGVIAYFVNPETGEKIGEKNLFDHFGGQHRRLTGIVIRKPLDLWKYYNGMAGYIEDHGYNAD